MRTTGTEQQIFERADATQAVANTLFSGSSGYQWDEMSLFDFAARIASARNARRLADDKKADYDAQRGIVNALFDDLETRKIQALGMAKYRFRQDAEVTAMLESVGEYGDGREDTLKEADEWVAAWKNIDPTWSPTTGNSLAAFEALNLEGAAQLKTLTNLKSNARKAGIDLNALLAELEDLCVAWYGVATRAFPVGTMEGDLIRSQIPTFVGGSPAVAPTPAPTP